MVTRNGELEYPKGFLIFDSQRSLEYFCKLWDEIVKGPTIVNRPPPYWREFPQRDKENTTDDRRE